MSFAPVYSENSRALILGTWPSPKSREMAFYYGHPQNRFWPMMAALTGEPVPAREDIEAKKGIILRHGLALWDTLESCTITGASDASIRDVVPNDIASLLAKAPIEAVFCMLISTYPGNIFLATCLLAPFLTSITSCIGTETSKI